MIRIAQVLMAPLLFVLVTTPSAAQANPDLGRGGPYFQVGAAGAFNSFDSSVTVDPRMPPVGGPVNPSGGAAAATAGYRFNAWYALDADFQWARMDDERSTPVAGGVSNRGLEVESWTLMATGRLYFLADIESRFQPYLRLGMGYMRTQTRNVIEDFSCTPGCALVSRTKVDNTEGGFGMKFGIGADIHLKRNFYLYMDYAYNNGVSNVIELLDYHTLGGGAGFRW